MNRWLLAGCVAIASGCAVTEPTEMDTARVRSAIEADSGVSIPQLALELGVSELAVVRALPDHNARRWQGEPMQAWEEVAKWPVVRLRTEQAAFLGSPSDAEIVQDGAALTDQHRFRIQVDFTAIEEVWLVAHLHEGDIHQGVWWFNESGEVVLRAQVPLIGVGADEADGRYRKLWGSLAPATSQ